MTRFFLSNPKRKVSNISIEVNAFGWKLRKSVGLSIYSIQWDKKKQRAKFIRPEYVKINNMLDGMESASNGLIYDFKIKRILPSPDEFADELFKDDQIINKPLNLWAQIDNFLNEKKELIQHNSWKHIKSSFELFKKFNPKATKITDDTLSSFTNFLLSRKYSSNYINKVLARIIMFCEWSGKSVKKKINVKNKPTDKTYISLNEIDLIIKANIYEPHLNLTRDVFIIQCFTGLRHSDLSKLNSSMIKETDGHKFIELISKKTGTKSVIPIFPIVEEIITKYKGIPSVIVSQAYNRQIQEVCRLSGLTDLISLSKLEGEKKVPYQIEKYKAISSHTARRSFVTNLSKLGLSSKQISLMTGHSQQRIVDIYDKTKGEENAISVIDLLKGRI